MNRALVFPAENVTIDQLSERQAAFVREYVRSGGRNAAAAARKAGYPASAAGVRASELLRRPKILAVLRDELTKRLNAGAAVAVETLIDLARSAESEATRLAAANSLMDRTLGPPISRSANMHVHRTIDQALIDLDIEESRESSVIDAEAVEVTPKGG